MIARATLVVALLLTAPAAASDPVLVPSSPAREVVQVRAWGGTVAVLRTIGRRGIHADLVLRRPGGSRRVALGLWRRGAVDVGPGRDGRPEVVVARCRLRCAVFRLHGTQLERLHGLRGRRCDITAVTAWRGTVGYARAGRVCRHAGLYALRGGHSPHAMAGFTGRQVLEADRVGSRIAFLGARRSGVVDRRGRFRRYDTDVPSSLSADRHRACWYEEEFYEGTTYGPWIACAEMRTGRLQSYDDTFGGELPSVLGLDRGRFAYVGERGAVRRDANSRLADPLLARAAVSSPQLLASAADASGTVLAVTLAHYRVGVQVAAPGRGLRRLSLPARTTDVDQDVAAAAIGPGGRIAAAWTVVRGEDSAVYVARGTLRGGLASVRRIRGVTLEDAPVALNADPLRLAYRADGTLALVVLDYAGARVARARPGRPFARPRLVLRAPDDYAETNALLDATWTDRGLLVTDWSSAGLRTSLRGRVRRRGRLRARLLGDYPALMTDRAGGQLLVQPRPDDDDPDELLTAARGPREAFRGLPLAGPGPVHQLDSLAGAPDGTAAVAYERDAFPRTEQLVRFRSARLFSGNRPLWGPAVRWRRSRTRGFLVVAAAPGGHVGVLDCAGAMPVVAVGSATTGLGPRRRLPGRRGDGGCALHVFADGSAAVVRATMAGGVNLVRVR